MYHSSVFPRDCSFNSVVRQRCLISLTFFNFMTFLYNKSSALQLPYSCFFFFCRQPVSSDLTGTTVIDWINAETSSVNDIKCKLHNYYVSPYIVEVKEQPSAASQCPMPITLSVSISLTLSLSLSLPPLSLFLSFPPPSLSSLSLSLTLSLSLSFSHYFLSTSSQLSAVK